MTHVWTHDDDIVVIDVYLRHGALQADRTEVRTLARLIGTTPASVAMALGNVRGLATGTGLGNHSSHMARMWGKWGHRPAEVAVEAAAARRRIEDAARGTVPPLTSEQQARIDARVAERRRERGL